MMSPEFSVVNLFGEWISIMQSAAESARATKLARQVRQFCKANSNDAIVMKYSRFFREGYSAYGLDDKAYDKGVALVSTDNKMTLQTALGAAPYLLKSGKYEETIFAIRFLKMHVSEFTSDTFRRLEKWFDYGISNWAHADILSGDVFPVFIIENIVPLQTFGPWRSGPNKFQRRAAAVTLIKILKERKSFREFFEFIEPLMTDSAREVHQGVGWFLREAWKLRKTETEKFLMKWKNESPRLIYQYATEKMTPAQKRMFKRNG
jgi:3-methyladenine DNA glycosylase AlkD